MRKRIVAFMMAGVMALGLTGCGSVLKIEDKKSSNSVDMDMISKFYDQFYEEHTGDAEHFVDIDIDSDEEKTISIDTAPYLDCSANMEYCDGQWIMTIADFLGYAKSDYGDVVPKYDIYFYKCGATVEKLAVKKNVRCNCLVEMYLDNKLYITDKSIQGFGEYYDEDNEDLDNVTTFYVSLDDGACVDDKFENIFNNSKDEENIFTVDYVINKRFEEIDMPNVEDNLCGDKFTGWLETMAESDIKNQVDVAISKAYYKADNHLIASYMDEAYELLKKKLGREPDDKYYDITFFKMQEIEIYVNDVEYAYVDEKLSLYPADIWDYYDEEYVMGDETVREKYDDDSLKGNSWVLKYLCRYIGDYAQNIRQFDKTIVLKSTPEDESQIKSEIAGIPVTGYSLKSEQYYNKWSDLKDSEECMDIIWGIFTWYSENIWQSSYEGKIVTGTELEKDLTGINEYLKLMESLRGYVINNDADYRDLLDTYTLEDGNLSWDIVELNGIIEESGIDTEKYPGYTLLGTSYCDYGIKKSSEGKAIIYIIMDSADDPIELYPSMPGYGVCLPIDVSAMNAEGSSKGKKDSVTREVITESHNKTETEATTEATTGELMDNNIGSGGSASATEYVTTNGNKFTVPDGFMVTYGVQGGSWFQLKNASLDMNIEVREYTQDVPDYMQHRPGGVNSTDNVESVYTDSGDEYSVDSGYYGDNHDRVYYDKVVLQSRDKTSRLGIFINYSTKDKSKCDEIVTSFLDDFQYIDSDRDANDISTDVSSVKEAWKKAYINEMYSVGKSTDDPTMGTTGYLYDIDGDGIPELMTGYSTSASTGPMEVHTYTYKNGKLIKMDSIIGAFESVYTYNGYVVQQTTNGSVGMGCGLRIYSFTGESLDKLMDVKLDYKLDSDGNPKVISNMGSMSYADVEALLDKCSTSLTKENFGTGDSDQAYSYYLDTEHGLKRMTDNSLDGREAIIRAVEEY